MKRPSFQFYPGDWQANSNLRRCTHAEKGVWLDVMCLMHDQPEYGVLRWPLKEIAQAVGAKLSDLRGLVSKGVIKGSDAALEVAEVYTPRSGRKDGEPVTLVAAQAGPVWYSSRMTKDEHIRAHAGASTRFGAKPDTQPSDSDAPSRSPKSAPSRSPSRRHGEDQGEYQSDGSSSSSSSSSSIEPYGSKASGKPEPLLTTQDLIGEGVDETVAADWMRVRKTKKALLTKTAWDGIKREASLAGLTPAQAVKHAAENNWQGFKASWLDGDRGKSAGGANDWTVSAS